MENKNLASIDVTDSARLRGKVDHTTWHACKSRLKLLGLPQTPKRIGFLLWLEHTLAMITFMIGMVPVPAFLQQHSIGSILGAAGPTVGWMVSTFKVGESLAMISAAMTFFIIRRFFTLGIW